MVQYIVFMLIFRWLKPRAIKNEMDFDVGAVSAGDGRILNCCLSVQTSFPVTGVQDF